MERDEFEALLLLMGYKKSIIANHYYKGARVSPQTGKKVVVRINDDGAEVKARADAHKKFPKTPTFRGNFEDVAQWLKNWQS